MSALGQKWTFASQKVVSALPCIATMKAYSRKRSGLLYPRKRTCAVQLAMSALGHKRTFGHYATVRQTYVSGIEPIDLSAGRVCPPHPSAFGNLPRGNPRNL